jgi:hypothetical protein
MKNLTSRYCHLFLLVFLISLFISPMKAVGQDQPSDNIDTAQFAQVRIEKLQQAGKQLHELGAQPLPKNLAADEKTQAMRYTRWLINSSRKLNDLASRWQNKLNDVGMTQSRVLSMKQMKEANTSFNRQYSVIRDELSRELRQYAMISHRMKGNYDSVQSSINSLR